MKKNFDILGMTLTLYPYNGLGHANHGWLDARHHFSFARYWNPARTQFGALRVINDDTIAAGRGFAPHSHDNMEIITYVRSGAITHRDSLGHEGRTQAGDVQVMSAGQGVTHSEFNLEDGNTTLYQIWIEPNCRNVAPRWDAQQFPAQEVTQNLPVLVSGQVEHTGMGALFIHQDAALYGGHLAQGTVITQRLKHNAYILASVGSFSVTLPDGACAVMARGDGLEVVGAGSFEIKALTVCEILVLDVPMDYGDITAM